MQSLSPNLAKLDNLATFLPLSTARFLAIVSAQNCMIMHSFV
jgi:hypothetical protein